MAAGRGRLRIEALNGSCINIAVRNTTGFIEILLMTYFIV